MRLIALLAAASLALPARADIVVRDDTGQDVRLKAPAKRIVTLAPHAAESLFAAGAGDRLVGTVHYSDHPEAAAKVPSVGGYDRFDVEAVAALKPDLVIAWQSGNHPSQLQRLRDLGITVFVGQPNRLDDIPNQLRQYGRLAGTEAVADAAADAFQKRLAALRRDYSGKPRVRTFYQVWNTPLMTVGAPQIITSVITLCGGENVFGQLDAMSPKVTVEAVLQADPEAIVASGMGESRPEWLDDWRRWRSLTAVKRNNLFHVAPQLLQRHTPRLLDGAERLCQALDTARQRRPAP